MKPVFTLLLECPGGSVDVGYCSTYGGAVVNGVRALKAGDATRWYVICPHGCTLAAELGTFREVWTLCNKHQHLKLVPPPYRRETAP